MFLLRSFVKKRPLPLLLWKIMPLLTVSDLENTIIVQTGLPFHCQICVSSISQLNEETQTGTFQVTSFSNRQETVLWWMMLVCNIYK